MAKKKPYKDPFPIPEKYARRYKDIDVTNMNDMPEEIKISARVVNLTMPWYKQLKTSLIADLAALAWNETVNEDFGQTYSAEFNNDREIIDAHRGVVDEIKKLKRTLYPNDARGINSTFVRVAADGDEKINVISQMLPDSLDGVFEDIMNCNIVPMTEETLCEAIRKVLPVYAYVSNYLASGHKEAKKLKGRRLEIEGVENAGEAGGVMLFIKDSPLVCSATHLEFRDEGEIYDMLRSYQESRNEWLATQDTRGFIKTFETGPRKRR